MRQSLDFGIADVLSGELKDGQVRLNIGNATTGKGTDSQVAVYAIDGFYSMPNDPASDGAAQVFWFRDGERKVVVGGRDNRWISGYGTLDAGDRAITSNCDAMIALKRANSAIVMFSKNQTDSNSDMVYDFNGKEGRITFLNGQAIINMSKDTITMTAGGTTVEIGPDGFFVNGNHCGLNTNGGNLGATGMIPPITGPQSLIFGVSGVSGAPSTKWTIGG